MTLYELLVNHLTKNVEDGLRYILTNDAKFHNSMGRAHLCEELINTLSDETLKIEVVTRGEYMTKGATNVQGV